VNQLDELGERVILILDDYTFITDSQIQAFVTILISNLPPNLHLVLASRIDPMLPLARARSHGNVAELRAADLRFTREETRSFVESTMSAVVDSAGITLLDERLEGG